jgi:uncharacterized protein (DUF849 family)
LRKAGKRQFALCNQSLIMGGNFRVGLEDNLYPEKGPGQKQRRTGG